MASRPAVKIAVKISDYTGINTLQALVIATMTTNVADFPVPVPSLADATTANGTLGSAIAQWGPQGNRGSHADLIALRAAARAVYNNLLLLAAYVQNLVDLSLPYPDQASFILLSGFAVKNSPSPQGVLAAPEEFTQQLGNTISLYAPKLMWKKPLGLQSPGNVKSYDVLRSLTDNINDAVVVGNPTKTSFIDNTVAVSTVYYYFVRGVNAAGAGLPTLSVLVSIPA